MDYSSGIGPSSLSYYNTQPQYEDTQQAPLAQAQSVGPVGAANVQSRHAAKPTQADLNDVRSRFQVPAGQHTVAVARTNIPGLENALFHGLSSEPRRAAEKLANKGKISEYPTPLNDNRAIKTPHPGNAYLTGHGEEVLLNQAHDAIEHQKTYNGLTENDLYGKELNVLISHDKGACGTCTGGLLEKTKSGGKSKSYDNDGVYKQFSMRHPGLRTIFSSAANPMTGEATPAAEHNFKQRTALRVKNGGEVGTPTNSGEASQHSDTQYTYPDPTKTQHGPYYSAQASGYGQQQHYSQAPPATYDSSHYHQQPQQHTQQGYSQYPAAGTYSSQYPPSAISYTPVAHTTAQQGDPAVHYAMNALNGPHQYSGQEPEYDDPQYHQNYDYGQ